MKRLGFQKTIKPPMKIPNPIKDGIKRTISEADEDIPPEIKNRAFADNLSYIILQIVENKLWTDLAPQFVQDGDMALLIIFNTPDSHKTYYPVSNRYLDKADFYNTIIVPWKGAQEKDATK